MTGIASRVRKGSLWVGGARIIVSVLGLVSTIVLARLLTPADFGVVAIGTTILLISTALTELSLTNALIHHEDPDRRHLDTAWTLNLLRGLALALLLFALAPIVAQFYDDARLETVVQFIALSAFLSGLLNPKLALLKRDLHFWQDFALQTSQKLAMVVVSIAMAVIFRSYVALIGGLVAGQLVAVIVSYAFVPHRPRFRLKETREFLDFSGWLVLDQILQTLIWRVDPLIIGKFVGSAQLGLFTLSRTIALIPTRDSIAPLGATLFPAFRQLRDAPERLRRAYLRAQSTVAAIALPAGFLLAAVAEPLVYAALGEKWSDAVPIIEVLAVLIALQALGTASRPLALAQGMTKLLFQRSLIAATYRLPIIVASLAWAGLDGLLVGLVAVHLLGLLLDLNLAARAAGIGPIDHFRVNWRTLVAATLAFLAASQIVGMIGSPADLWTAMATLSIGALAGSIVYLVALFGLWAISGREEGAETEILSVLAGIAGHFGIGGTGQEEAGHDR